MEVLADLIARGFLRAGHAVTRQPVTEGLSPAENIETEIRGRDLPEQLVVVGTHYPSTRTAEPPTMPARWPCCWPWRAPLASALYAHGALRSLRRRRDDARRDPDAPAEPRDGCVRAEKRTRCSTSAVGLREAERGAREKPVLAFVGNLSSRGFVSRAKRAFSGASVVPARGVALPGVLPMLRGSSHTTFWREGSPAVMVVDAGSSRKGRAADAGSHELDYARVARIVPGLAAVITDFARSDVPT